MHCWSQASHPYAVLNSLPNCMFIDECCIITYTWCQVDMHTKLIFHRLYAYQLNIKFVLQSYMHSIKIVEFSQSWQKSSDIHNSRFIVMSLLTSLSYIPSPVNHVLQVIVGFNLHSLHGSMCWCCCVITVCGTPHNCSSGMFPVLVSHSMCWKVTHHQSGKHWTL